MNDERRPRRRRVALVVLSSPYTAVYVGAFFGWGPMQLLLERSGAFSWKCDTVQVCPAQTTALLNVQLVAQTTQLLSPLLGLFVDHYGARAAAYCMAGTLWLALSLLTMS